VTGYLVVALSQIFARPAANFVPYYAASDELFAVGVEVLCDGQRSGKYHRRLDHQPLKRVKNRMNIQDA
jgi:hypothetical protein